MKAVYTMRDNCVKLPSARKAEEIFVACQKAKGLSWTRGKMEEVAGMTFGRPESDKAVLRALNCFGGSMVADCVQTLVSAIPWPSVGILETDTDWESALVLVWLWKYYPNIIKEKETGVVWFVDGQGKKLATVAEKLNWEND